MNTPVKGPEPHSDEWHALRLWDPERERKIVFGASDAAVLCNRSEYATPWSFFQQATGREEPFAGNKYTRLGKRMERPIILEYQDEAGTQVDAPLPMFFHGEIAYLGATPDGICIPVPKLVECKFTVSRKRAAELGEEHSDFVPDEWMLQAQQQMDVCQVAECDVVVMLFGRLRIYSLQRNVTLIDLIHAAAKEMYERLSNDDPPDPDWTHSRNQELIATLHGVREGEEVVLGPEAVDAWRAYQELGKEIGQRDKARKAAKAEIVHALGECAIGVLPDGEHYIERHVGADTLWTEDDVDDVQAKIGEVKRRGSTRLYSKTVK